MRKHVNVLEAFFYISLLAPSLGLIIFRPPLSDSLFKAIGTLQIGYAFIGMGVLGLLKNSILLTRGKPLKYEKDSSIGTTVNILFIIFGTLAILFVVVISILECLGI